ANRTLVLINGRRGAPINATNVIDTNAIPSSAIERVEIVSGGASAVYGADAMAGVVNFILKDNFEGFEIDTQMGTTAEGDGEEFRFSALAGGNVNDGRGNFMLGAEYASREPALQVKRSWRVDELRNPYLSGSEFGVPTITRIDNDSVIIDTCPDPTTPGIDCALDVGNPFSQAAADAVFSELPPGTIPSTRTPGAPVPPDAVPVLTSWFVNPSPDGTGTVLAGVWGGQGGFNENTNGSPPAPAAYKYTGPLESPECGAAPFRKIMADGSLTQNNCSVRYSAPLERYALFGNGQLELSDRISAFIRGTFSRSRTDTVYSYLSATGVRDIGIPHGDEIYTGDPAAGVPSSLNEDGTTHEAYLPGGAYGLNCAPVGGCTLSEVWPTPPEVAALLDSRPNPNAPFRVDHPLTYLPRSTTKSVTTTYQLLVGLEGELDNGWRWDASVSQGETNNITHQPNYVARERLRTLANRPNY